MTNDLRRTSPSVGRNRDAILAVLLPLLPTRGLVLEIASGSGEHLVHFAQAASRDLVFQPTDPDADARASIDAWVTSLGLNQIRPALALDATADIWPIQQSARLSALAPIQQNAPITASAVATGTHFPETLRSSQDSNPSSPIPAASASAPMR